MIPVPPHSPHSSTTAVEPHVTSHPEGAGSLHPQPKSSPTQSSTLSQTPSLSASAQYEIVEQSVTQAGKTEAPAPEIVKDDSSIHASPRFPTISKTVNVPDPAGITSPLKLKPSTVVGLVLTVKLLFDASPPFAPVMVTPVTSNWNPEISASISNEIGI